MAAPGSASDPIVLKMQVGTDIITVHGVLRQNLDCCAYTFKAAGGQKLYYKVSGAATRLVITAPNGDADGPNFENPYTLPATGAYTLTVSPDTASPGNEAIGSDSVTTTVELPDIVAVGGGDVEIAGDQAMPAPTPWPPLNANIARSLLF